MENLEQAEHVVVEETKPSPLHTVTPLSKYLAMTLFIILPFVGGWIGYMYAPQKVVEKEKTVIQEVEQTTPVEKPISIQKAVSVIQEQETGWPALVEKYDYSGATNIPWYQEPISQPDRTTLNKTNPRYAFDSCGFRREGDYDTDFINEIENGFDWNVGSTYNGMTYEGFECFGEKPWDHVISFVFSGDFTARGITSAGLGPNNFYVSKESAEQFNFLPITERRKRLASADTSQIWSMHSYGQRSSGIEMTVSSNFLNYSVSPHEVYDKAESLFNDTELGHDVPFEWFGFNILGYEVHEVIIEQIDWDNL